MQLAAAGVRVAASARSAEKLAGLGVRTEGIRHFKGLGCEDCRGTGYRGRVGVYEVMPITASIREIIFAKGNLGQLKAASKEAGFKTIREAAIIKLYQDKQEASPAEADQV